MNNDLKGHWRGRIRWFLFLKNYIFLCEIKSYQKLYMNVIMIIYIKTRNMVWKVILGHIRSPCFKFKMKDIYKYVSIFYVQHVSEKNLWGFLGHTGWYFPKLFLNYKINCISTSFTKEISILSNITKKLQARHYLHNCF